MIMPSGFLTAKGVFMPPKTKSLSVPEAMQARYVEITALTDVLCLEKLNEEYAQICREMTATLARKRPSPLTSGHTRSWACAIAYTVGSVNFLFDKSQTPHLRADDLCAWFGISKSTAGNKSSQIKQILKIPGTLFWDRNVSFKRGFPADPRFSFHNKNKIDVFMEL